VEQNISHVPTFTWSFSSPIGVTAPFDQRAELSMLPGQIFDHANHDLKLPSLNWTQPSPRAQARRDWRARRAPNFPR
jgi:hypothetical protein